MCKLIVIDDNPTDHYIMQRLLHNNYHCEQVTYAYDGQLVLDYLESSDILPDLIFLDLDMPVLTGWDFLDELETITRTTKKKVDVYIMTSSIRSEDVFQAKKYPCVNSFLTKPLSRDELMRICAQADENRNKLGDVA